MVASYIVICPSAMRRQMNWAQSRPSPNSSVKNRKPFTSQTAISKRVATFTHLRRAAPIYANGYNVLTNMRRRSPANSLIREHSITATIHNSNYQDAVVPKFYMVCVRKRRPLVVSAFEVALVLLLLLTIFAMRYGHHQVRTIDPGCVQSILFEPHGGTPTLIEDQVMCEKIITWYNKTLSNKVRAPLIDNPIPTPHTVTVALLSGNHFAFQVSSGSPTTIVIDYRVELAPSVESW